MDELVLLLGHSLVMHAVEVALLPELVPGCRRLHEQHEDYRVESVQQQCVNVGSESDLQQMHISASWACTNARLRSLCKMLFCAQCNLLQQGVRVCM